MTARSDIRYSYRGAYAISFLLSLCPIVADETCADVIDGTATLNADETWTFAATVLSTETGWEKYANEWQVVDSQDGSLLGTRVLQHPHVNEQPFTRTLPRIEVPEQTTSVILSAQDSQLGYCGESFELQIREDTGNETSTSSEEETFSNTSAEEDMEEAGSSSIFYKASLGYTAVLCFVYVLF